MQGGKLYPLALAVAAFSLVAIGCKSSGNVGLTEVPKGKELANNGNGNNNGGGGNTNGGPGGGGVLPPGGGGSGTNNNGGGNNGNGGNDNGGGNGNNGNGDGNSNGGQPVIDRVTLAPLTVHFDYDSSALRPSDMVKVQNVANYLATQPTHLIVVEGHCDERGTEQYNLSLGERRALTIRDELLRLGVTAGQVRWISYGEEQPVVAGSDDKSYSENRRGEFVVVKPAQSPVVNP